MGVPMESKKSPKISIIAAIGTQTRALGKNNGLIWRIPEDLKRFKALTTDHPVIMGRKTFESIGRPLPNRTNIVISRDTQYRPAGVTIAQSLESALEHASALENSEVFVIGGGQIYTQALPYADRLYLTLIEETSSTKADTFFPEYSDFNKVVEKEDHAHDGLSYSWVTLEK